MKKSLFTLLYFFFLTSIVIAQSNTTTKTQPKGKTSAELAKSNEAAKKTIIPSQAVQGVDMKFDTELIDLGKVKKGEKRKFKYNFTNTGSEVIEFDIVSGCDCTTTDWPRTPIKKGQKGVIDVTFDSTEKEKSETVDVDIYLSNKDPKTGRAIFRRVKYKFELVN
jgi:Protein of unknown function (DUF1573)